MTVPWELERMAPRHGRGERVVLDPRVRAYSVGRSARCAIRLFSPTASRRHAELVQGEDGRWWLRAAEGRTVLADGAEIVGACELCEGLSLELGGDRFRCQRQRDGATRSIPLVRAQRAPHDRRFLVAALVGLSLLAAGVALFWRYGS